MADRPNTPVPTLSDIENPIEDGQSPAGASGEDLEAFMLREEERAIASAAAKLTRPTTRLANVTMPVLEEHSFPVPQTRPPRWRS